MHDRITYDPLSFFLWPAPALAPSLPPFLLKCSQRPFSCVPDRTYPSQDALPAPLPPRIYYPSVTPEWHPSSLPYTVCVAWQPLGAHGRGHARGDRLRRCSRTSGCTMELG